MSISSRETEHKAHRTTGALLLISAPLLAAGLVMPALSVTRFALFGATYSILDGVFAFWSDGRYGLFFVVFVTFVVIT